MGSFSVKRAGGSHCAGKIRFGAQQLHGFFFTRKQRKPVFGKPVAAARERHIFGIARGADRNEHPSGTQKDRCVQLRVTQLGLPQTYFQLNVANLFNERYFSNLTTGTDSTSTTRYTFGSPRTFVASIHFGF